MISQIYDLLKLQLTYYYYLRAIITSTLISREKEFAQLIKDNQGLIIKVSRLYTNSLEDEEDLFQEIVLQLWRSYDSFKGNSKISTWMYRVALNTAITLFRKKAKAFLPTNWTSTTEILWKMMMKNSNRSLFCTL
ncbi:sigma-70 family RNA polymerase sigma factor [Chryseobacterium daecheongense]|nr:sigma-70 family RNA polymerase sigma factor [Chryseobacterium daecheongense]